MERLSDKRILHATKGDKRRIVILIACLLLASLFFVVFTVLFKTFFGHEEEGFVDDIATLPYVGKYFKDFQVHGNIRYACRVSHFRPGRYVVFTGSTSEEAVKSFCDKEDGWNFFSTEDSLVYFNRRLEFLGADRADFPISISGDFNLARKAVDGLIIEINFQQNVGEFTAFAFKTL